MEVMLNMKWYVISHRISGRALHYVVKWSGYTEEHNSREPASKFDDAVDAAQDYWPTAHPRRMETGNGWQAINAPREQGVGKPFPDWCIETGRNGCCSHLCQCSSVTVTSGEVPQLLEVQARFKHAAMVMIQY